MSPDDLDPPSPPWLAPLDSARLRLIVADLDHAEAFADAAMESDPEITQWSKRVTGGRTRATYLQSAIERAASSISGTLVQRYAFTRDIATFIASVSMHPWRAASTDGPIPGSELRVDQSPDLELGFWCRTPMAGNGYATEAVSAVVEHAFEDLHAHAVWLRIAETNARSRRLAERLAFVEVERVQFPASPDWGEAATVLFMRRLR